MSEAVILQDPAETLDHTLDWTSWLGTDTIATSTRSIDPTGPNITSPAATNTGTSATVWVSGVSFGQVYQLRNQIVTAEGRTSERSITIRAFSE